MKMNSIKSIVLAFFCLLLVASCGSSSVMKNSWVKEKYTFANDPAQKVLLVAIAKDEAIRNRVEDDMKAAFYGNVPAVEVSYPFIKYGTEAEKLVKFIELENFTHIVTMRVADVNKDIEYRPGTYYAGGYGYYPRYYGYYGSYFGRVWPSTYYAPGSYEESVEYTIETNVYSAKEKELVYSAMTSSFKGSGLNETISATLRTVAEDLQKRGLINTKK